MSMGLLLVTMEPPPAMAEEFHDWYDTEHIPERRALPGFRSAARWVCLHGWPRFLALYDLDSPATLETPEYQAVSGDRSSPWSRRVLPRTLGRQRVVAEQVRPGTAELSQAAGLSCLVVARYPEPPQAEPSSPGLLQARVFRRVDGPRDGWVVAAFDRTVAPAAAQDAFGLLGTSPASMLNIYVPYIR